MSNAHFANKVGYYAKNMASLFVRISKNLTKFLPFPISKGFDINDRPKNTHDLLSPEKTRSVFSCAFRLGFWDRYQQLPVPTIFLRIPFRFLCWLGGQMGWFKCCMSEERLGRKALKKSIKEYRDAETLASYANISFKTGKLFWSNDRFLEFKKQWILHHNLEDW